MLNPLCKQPVMVTPGVVMGAQAGPDGRSDFPGEPRAVAVFTQQLIPRGPSQLSQKTQQHPGPGPVT